MTERGCYGITKRESVDASKFLLVVDEQLLKTSTTQSKSFFQILKIK